MIRSRPTSAPPPPYRGPIATALDYIERLVLDNAQVRTLVADREAVAGPLDLAACLAKPGKLPWVYYTVTAGVPAVLGSGSAGTPTVGNDLDVAFAAVVAGTDPAAALRIWDALNNAIFDGYRSTSRLTAMWDAGVSAIWPAQGPATLQSADGRSAVLGSFRVSI